MLEKYSGVEDFYIPEYLLESRDHEPQAIVDRAAARAVVWKSQVYAFLLRQLLGADDDVAGATLKDVERQLSGWPEFSELDPSFIDDIRADADAAIREIYEQVTRDLQITGRFNVERITEMDILP